MLPIVAARPWPAEPGVLAAGRPDVERSYGRDDCLIHADYK